MVDLWRYLVEHPAAFSVFVAAVALGFNVKVQARANLQARAKLVSDALDAFSRDSDMQAAYYRIEWGTFEWRAELHQPSDEERALDKLLRHFSGLARLYRLGVLKRVDLEPVDYYLARIVSNTFVKKYLEFVSSIPRQKAMKHPYNALVDISGEFRPADEDDVELLSEAVEYDGQGLDGRDVSFEGEAVLHGSQQARGLRE